MKNRHLWTLVLSLCAIMSTSHSAGAQVVGGASGGAAAGGRGGRSSAAAAGGMTQTAAAEQIILRFALIEAMNSAHRDPAIAEVDTVLRDLFRFAGYRLLAQAAVSASPGARTSQLLSAAGTEYALDIYVAPRGAVRGASAGGRGGALTGVLGGAAAGGRGGQGVTASGGGRASASPASVSLEVSLTQNRQDRRTILHTTVSISTGHTLVLGSTQPSGMASTLILTVRPEIK